MPPTSTNPMKASSAAGVVSVGQIPVGGEHNAVVEIEDSSADYSEYPVGRRSSAGGRGAPGLPRSISPGPGPTVGDGDRIELPPKHSSRPGRAHTARGNASRGKLDTIAAGQAKKLSIMERGRMKVGGASSSGQRMQSHM